MLNISPISNNVVKFKQNNHQENAVIYKTYKTEATTGKKWGVGIASWLLPGSGQAINNEWRKGIGFFSLSVIAPIILSAITGVGMIAGLKHNSRIATTAGMVGFGASWLMGLGGRIWACVDAVKHAKSEIDIPINNK